MVLFKPQLLNERIEGELMVREFTRDGKTISHVVKSWIQIEPNEITEPKATIEEVSEETLLETKYQTFLLEMMV